MSAADEEPVLRKRLLLYPPAKTDHIKKVSDRCFLVCSRQLENNLQDHQGGSWHLTWNALQVYLALQTTPITPCSRSARRNRARAARGPRSFSPAGSLVGSVFSRAVGPLLVAEPAPYSHSFVGLRRYVKPIGANSRATSLSNTS